MGQRLFKIGRHRGGLAIVAFASVILLDLDKKYPLRAQGCRRRCAATDVFAEKRRASARLRLC
jgi:hypothetical protein